MLKRVNELLPKFSTKKKEQTKQQQLDLSISDCTCPICLEILVEPVNMPCKHEICLKCFDTMLDQTNLCCPMCRLRVSTWARNARLTQTLVNNDRWKQIQEAFPTEIKNRLEGKTQEELVESLAAMMPKKPKCAEQGEIRKEYLEYMKREQERLRLEKENEERLSMAYIQQVIREEGVIALDGYLLREQQIGIVNQQQQPQPPQAPIQQPVQSIQQQPQNVQTNILNRNQNVINLPEPPQQQQQQQPIPVNVDNNFITPPVIATAVSRKRPLKGNNSGPNEEYSVITRSKSLRLAAKPTNLTSTPTNTIATRNIRRTSNNQHSLEVNNSSNSTASSTSAIENDLNSTVSARPQAKRSKVAKKSKN